MAFKRVSTQRKRPVAKPVAKAPVPIKPVVPPKILPGSNVTSPAEASAEYRALRGYYDKNGHIPTILAKESQNRFGEAHGTTLSDLGKQVAYGKISLDEARRLVRQGAAARDPDAIRAGLDASADIDPKVNAAERKRRELAENLRRSIGADESSTKEYSSTVADLFARLTGRMQEQKSQIGATYDTATAGIAANTGALSDQIRAAYEKANAGAAERVAGMGGGTTEAQTQGGQDAAFLSGLAGLQGQGLAGIMAAGKTGALNSQGAAINFADWQGTNTQSDALRELLARTNNSRADANNQDLEFGGQIADLEESRYNKLYEGKKALAQARAEAESAAEQTAFERRLAEEKLGISRGELDIKKGNLDIAQQKVQNDITRLGLDQRKIDVDIRKTEAQIRKEQAGLTPGTIEYMEKEAAINLKRAQAAGTLTNARTGQVNAATNQQRAATAAAAQQAKANQPPKPGAYGKGLGGVQNYLKDIGADGKSSSLVQKRVSAVIAKHEKFPDGLKATEAWIKKNKPPRDVANAMRRSVGIAYGRSS